MIEAKTAPADALRRHLEDLRRWIASAEPGQHKAKLETELAALEGDPEITARLRPEPPDFASIPPAEGYDTLADFAAEIARLAALPQHEYERARRDEAKRLGIRASALDKAVNQARPKDAAQLQGRAVTLTEIEPWGEAVDGAELLEALVAQLGRFVIAPEPSLVAIALWVIHTHAFSVWWISPKLMLNSATKRSGKTLLCDLIERLTPRPLLASGATSSSIYRLIEQAGDTPPCLILDELDEATLQDEQLRKLINSSQRKSAARVLLSVPTADGWESRAFSTWAPMVLSGIGTQAGTVVDRSIIVTLQRKRGVQRIERLRGDRDHGFGELARKCARWAADRLEALVDLDPTPAMGLHDRAKDNWAPLLAIADSAGGVWPERARAAAQELQAAVDELEAAELGLQLLADIRTIFDEQQAQRLPTGGLVAILQNLPERPWRIYKGGAGLNDWHLANLLRDFGIRSRQLKFPQWELIGGTSKKDKTLINRHGFERRQFEEAWERYSPSAIPPSEPATPLHSKVSAASSPSQPATAKNEVAGSNGLKPAENLKGRGVAGSRGDIDTKGGKACAVCGEAVHGDDVVNTRRGDVLHHRCVTRWATAAPPTPRDLRPDEAHAILAEPADQTGTTSQAAEAAALNAAAQPAPIPGADQLANLKAAREAVAKEHPPIAPWWDSEGSRIRAAREKRGWSQKVLAAKTETYQSVISNLECNKAVDPDVQARVLAALGLLSSGQ